MHLVHSRLCSSENFPPELLSAKLNINKFHYETPYNSGTSTFLYSRCISVIDFLALHTVSNVSSLYVAYNIEKVLNPLVSCQDPSRRLSFSQVLGGPWLTQETNFAITRKTWRAFTPADWFQNYKRNVISQLKKKSAATGLNKAIASAHTQTA
jgi:hypothetical protein